MWQPLWSQAAAGASAQALTSSSLRRWASGPSVQMVQACAAVEMYPCAFQAAPGLAVLHEAMVSDRQKTYPALHQGLMGSRRQAAAALSCSSERVC